jgi:nucleoside-diphosphate-sugar epimerase
LAIRWCALGLIINVKNNLLIVGGTGFIGKHLALAAIKKGYATTVISLNKVSNNQRIKDVNYLLADVANYESLEKVLIYSSYSHVVNLGGYVNHAKYKEGGREVFDTHFVGVQNLVSLLDWNPLKSFVQIGSSDEYGDIPAPQSEDSSEKPISPYSAGKVAASMLLQMLHRTEQFPAVILRLFLVYGPGQQENRFIPQIIKGCIRSENFPVSKGEQLRDFCYIDDVVNGILEAMIHPQAIGEVLNIASGNPMKVKDVISQIRKLIGSGGVDYGAIPYRTGENMSLYGDINKAKKILSWESSTGFSEGILKSITYYKSKSTE